jgi:hypothetical protein
MIKMLNIDQHIWDLEFLVVDIIKEFQQTGSIVIDLNKEGPDATELGLYKLLDYLCSKYKINKNSVTIMTRNILEQHSDYRIIVRSPWSTYAAQTFAKSNDYTQKDFAQIKHFGLFVGRSNWQRLWVSAEMFGKYNTQTLQTFLYDSANDFHKSHLGFDRLVNKLQGQCNYADITKLISSAPVELESINQFPIQTPTHFNIAKNYHKFLIELVCETYTAGNSFFPTEKTWRPLICKTPFMVQGPVNFLKNLRQLGFKTFGQYWDESYDEDGQILGTKTILRNVEHLSKLSTGELQSMYNDMKPLLDHNYNVMMELSPTSFNLLK